MIARRLRAREAVSISPVFYIRKCGNSFSERVGVGTKFPPNKINPSSVSNFSLRSETLGRAA
jgi:hypothetical protein